MLSILPGVRTDTLASTTDAYMATVRHLTSPAGPGCRPADRARGEYTTAPSSTPAPRKRRQTKLTPAKPILPVRAVAGDGGRGRFVDDGLALRTVAGDALHPSPANPRKHFGAAEIAELAASMKQDGVLQPLLVRPLSPAMAALHEGDGEHFEIVAGERRWRAAREAGQRRAAVCTGRRW